jgi:hypothetical protein
MKTRKAANLHSWKSSVSLRIEELNERIVLSTVTPITVDTRALGAMNATLEKYAVTVAVQASFSGPLTGTIQGTYTTPQTSSNAGTKYTLQGTANLTNFGQATVTGSVTSVGIIQTGNAIGNLVISNSQGSAILSLTGPSQLSGATLPNTFTYKVISATGAFSSITTQGSLTMALDSLGHWSTNLNITSLNGVAQGTYSAVRSNPDFGTSYTLKGTINITGLGSYNLAGSVQSLGNVAVGQAQGQLVISNSLGSITLSITGPQQKGFAALPGTFSCSVVNATGVFSPATLVNSFQLTLNSNATFSATFGSATTPPPADSGYGSLVDSFYQKYLHREAEPAGRQVWIAALQKGLSAKLLTEYFLSSSEYLQLHGASQATYVRAIYTDILGRPGSEQEIATWVNVWNAGVGQKKVLQFILSSPEAASKNPTLRT